MVVDETTNSSAVACSSCPPPRGEADVRRDRRAHRAWRRNREPDPPAASRNRFRRALPSWGRKLLAHTRSHRSEAELTRRRDARLHGRRTRRGPAARREPGNQPLVRRPCACPHGVLANKKKFVAIERDTPENLQRRLVFCALVRALDDRHSSSSTSRSSKQECVARTGGRRSESASSERAPAGIGRRSRSSEPSGSARSLGL